MKDVKLPPKSAPGNLIEKSPESTTPKKSAAVEPAGVSGAASEAETPEGMPAQHKETPNEATTPTPSEATTPTPSEGTAGEKCHGEKSALEKIAADYDNNSRDSGTPQQEEQKVGDANLLNQATNA